MIQKLLKKIKNDNVAFKVIKLIPIQKVLFLVEANPEAKAHMNTAGRVPITTAARFSKSETVGPGPNFLSPISSLKKQLTSNRRSAESVTFGTATRDGALKLYATYTCKKF